MTAPLFQYKKNKKNRGYKPGGTKKMEWSSIYFSLFCN